jgi:hypothetical protein
MRAWKNVGALLLLAGACASAAEQAGHTLLPTGVLARDIRALPSIARPMRSRNDARAIKAQVAKVRREIGGFIIRQIDAYPSISTCELQKQLAAAFGAKGNGCGEWGDSDSPPPRIFAGSWGPKSASRVFVIAYCIWLGFYGEGGYETVLESYVWEREGSAYRGAGINPAGLSGFMTDMEQVCWFPNPDKYWVLVSGTMSGASGQALRGTAAVFEIGPEGATRIWGAPPEIGNVSAHAHDSRWEIEYVDLKRFYDRQPKATLLDIYRVDWSKRTYSRLAHLPLD